MPGSITGDRIADIGWKAFTGATTPPVDIADSRPAADDKDPNPTNPNGTGDGLTFIEEYRGVVAADLSQRRLNPGRLDVFIRSSLPQGLGYAFSSLPGQGLPPVTHRLGVNQGGGVFGKVVNFNSSGLAHVLDQGLVEIVSVGVCFPLATNGCSDSLGTSDCAYLGPPSGQGKGRICISNIQTHANDYVATPAGTNEDPAVLANRAVMTTIGHEVGHAINIDDYVFPTAPHPGISIMSDAFSNIPGWFPNPPSNYDAFDLQTLLLRN